MPDLYKKTVALCSKCKTKPVLKNAFKVKLRRLEILDLKKQTAAQK